MEFIKHNQLLKLRVSYDQDNGYYFSDFIESEDIERINNGRDYEYIKIGKPDGLHYTSADLKHDARVIEELLLLRHVIGNEFMPALTPEEGEDLFEQVREEDWDNVNLDTARRGLLSVSHLDWYAGISFWDDISAELHPYRYTARGYSQGDVAYLYLIGMDEHEAERLTKAFEQYAFDTPYQYAVALIDCETGETVTDESLGGIYDDTSDLRYLKCELKATINGMGEIHPELRDSALAAIAEIDYTTIDN
jgi:hypothetical protein|nr:MAG TPA: hypothetical protein [Caudoviricetes sp.]